MDEDIAIVNQNTKVLLAKNYIKKNAKKIFAIFVVLIFFLLAYFIISELDKRKKLKYAEVYNSITLNTDKYSEQEIINKLTYIIDGKVDTYSTLALYYLIDNKLIKDHNKINELFDIIIKINKEEEIKNLIIYKKALYFSDKFPENQLLKILNPVLNSESIWKQHALFLMGDFYFNKKQLNKSKEFFIKIVELNNVNNKLKIEAEKRLKRDFSE
mgnify:CR=1 FL=1|tara:strand:+ start:2027 stop:2668 length:642 start_codon:yes stop_codon:yes gene_type:complete